MCTHGGGLCKYRHIFGKEGAGVHSLRVFNVAIVDVIGTLAIAFAISQVMKWHFGLVAAGLFGLAILMHRLFCVQTTVDKLLFGVTPRINEAFWEE